MRPNSTTGGESASPAPLIPHDGVLALTGYGITITVDRGHLCCADGCGKERRSAQFPRAPRPFKRLVIVGHSGSLSFDALRWLHDVGVSLAVLDRDGEVLAAHGPTGLDDARLRRAQAQAVSNGVGVEVARDLLRSKIAGQADVLATMPDNDSSERVRKLIPLLDTATSADALRLVEADAAALYWQSWQSVTVNFAKRDATRVPAHWLTFGQRGSLVANGPRRATNPANALLNYLYAMLEVEARLAALAVGLDPGMGVMHADTRSRDSLACDLMEAVRPSVDAFVLGLLRKHTFAKGDFLENADGVCRVTIALTPTLAETAPRWARALAPIAERVAQALYDGRYVAPKVPQSSHIGRAVSPIGSEQNEGATRTQQPVLPTKLTEARRSRGRDKTRHAPERQIQESAPALFPACRSCGVRLTTYDRLYCAECLPEQRAEAVATFSAAGPAALAARRAAGDDPAHTPDANRQKGARNATHRADAAQWEHEHDESVDAQAFTRDVLPWLQGVSLRTIMESTGLSLRYSSLIRRGERIPHARHWQALRELAEQSRL